MNELTISERELQVLMEACRRSGRTPSEQAEHWMRIGRAMENDPRLELSRVEDALEGLCPVSSLDDTQQALFFEQLDAITREPGPGEAEYWADRQREGLGAGMDGEGNIIGGD